MLASPPRRSSKTSWLLQGKSKHDSAKLGLHRHQVWDWKGSPSGSTITRQMQRLGASCDWSRERFTMGRRPPAAVNGFIEWYRAGLLYRGKRLGALGSGAGTVVSDQVENI